MTHVTYTESRDRLREQCLFAAILVIAILCRSRHEEAKPSSPPSANANSALAQFALTGGR